MSTKIKLGTKLLLAFLAVGLLPAAVIGFISLEKAKGALEKQSFGQLQAVRGIKKAQIEKFFGERNGDMNVLVETVGTLRKESFDKLTAVREVKRAAVERHFQSIQNQILTFSEDRMIIDTMRQLRSSFRTVRTEDSVSPEELERMRSQLLSYYTDEFAAEYKKQNNGKAPDVEGIFQQLDEDTIALQYYYVRANTNPLGSKHKLDRAGDYSSYSRVHGEVHPIIRDYLEKFGYYDIFLVDPDTGDIIYTCYKELDYTTSLVDGPYAKSNIGEAFRKANAAGNKDAVVLVDYANYFPSYEAPAGFIASPIFDGGTKIGIAIFQIPIDRLNAIMSERAGLGKSGETYLVGPDKLMRSDSYLDSTHHSVIASFRNPDQGKVDTAAAKAALAGKVGAEVIIDYNGNPVLSAYTPVKVGDFTWALLAEIDVAEAFSPVDADGKEFFAKYKELYGYYDLFLINPDGYCFYTVAKEADYQTNLIDGKYSGSNLGKLVKQVIESRAFGMADFAPYAPSNGEPAAFIAQPVVADGRVELVVALQLSLDSINSIMTQRDGMGETGETYLIGPDKLMRSDSFLDPTNHTVKASFANPSKGNVDTEAARKALSGSTDAEVIIDYNGNPVLSAYTPVKVGGITWALLAEIDEAEAFAAVHALQYLMGVVGLVGLAAIIGLALFVTRSITKPITRIIAGLSDGADQVASASGQVSAASQQLAEGASEQAASIEETSSSLEEIASMTRQNAQNAAEANNLMKEANQLVARSNTSMTDLTSSMQDISHASDETSKIIRTIDEIAFQTNLLALNAAVEAARAGEAGAGFAVVADEVRNLAMRAAEAADSTANLIEGTIKKVKEGEELVMRTNQDFSEIVTSASKVGELVGEIAAASNEQTQGIEQINKAVAEMDKVVQQNAANAEESAAASEEMNAQADQMKGIVGDLTVLVNGSRMDERRQNAPGHSGRAPVKVRSVRMPPHDGKKGDGRDTTGGYGFHKDELSASKVIPFNDDVSDF